MVHLLPTASDLLVKDFAFQSGEILPDLTLHYTTLGKPSRDGHTNQVDNAVLVMHGTGGNGLGFLSEQFSGELFGPGQVLDTVKFFIILPDAIGHGQSSRPSQGLRARFPAYTYTDIVTAHRLVLQHLGVHRLRLVMGTSMGGMQTWMHGYMWPETVDALMPLASLPIEIAGLNRMRRKMIMDSITQDPAWKGGEYEAQPVLGLRGAVYGVLGMTSAPHQLQVQAPTRDAADALLASTIALQMESCDANDLLYQFNASRDYNPEPHLEKIVAPLVAVNSADDLVNPPELGVLEKHVRRVKRGRYVLIPVSELTRGHGTHSVAALWKHELDRLLKESQ